VSEDTTVLSIVAVSASSVEGELEQAANDVIRAAKMKNFFMIVF
jgi:hypothetical protein